MKRPTRGMTPEEKLYFYTKKNYGGCWEWTGGKNDKNYGYLWVDGRNISAHRFRWMTFYGEIPKGKQVLHHCDNPECTNPDHLFLGTQKDNMMDMVAKGRHGHARGEKHYAAKLTEQDVFNIRKEILSGIRKGSIAQKYRVTTTTIRSIQTGKIWGWLKPKEDSDGDRTRM